MAALDPTSAARFPLSEEQRMLLRMRDTLYEGSWDDFERDLRARKAGLPHVFVTVPTCPEMQATIEMHLALIGRMRDWEENHAVTLSADQSS